MYYRVLVPNKVIQEPVVYKSDFDITPYSLVKVPFGKKELFGFVIEQITEKDITYDLEKIVSVVTVYTIKLPHEIRHFISLCHKTTFLTPMVLVEQYITSITDTLGKRKLQDFEQKIPQLQDKNHKVKSKISPTNKRKNEMKYYLEIYIVLRIIYLIRSHIKYIITHSKNNPHKKEIRILIFFPEIKQLQNTMGELQEAITHDTELQNYSFRFYTYTHEKNNASKHTVYSLLTNLGDEYNTINSNELVSDKTVSKRITEEPTSEYCKKYNENGTSYNIEIICATKKGLFLPFTSIDHIMVIDEASSLYIQEQNSLYYDLRELVYLFSTSYNAHLSFISHLPSLRLANFNSDEFLHLDGINTLKDPKNGLKIQICTYNFSQEEKNALFSFQILGLLCDLDD